MKKIKEIFKPYGLRARFAISLSISAILCIILFLILYSICDYSLTNYYEKSEVSDSLIKNELKSLQNYINDNNISSSELQQLKNWEQKNPVTLLELYADNKCIYSSLYDITDNETYYDGNLYEYEGHTFSINLQDAKTTAVLYFDFTYRYYMIGTIASFVIAFTVFVFVFLRSNQKLINYICRLNEEVQILEGGNLNYQVSVEGNNEITDLANSMNRMRETFWQQMETEQSLYRANKRLVTQMSHDLRTPLTGIMLYLEILRSHKYKSDKELQDYLEKIYSKANQMKQMSDHLFEYSLIETSEKKNNPQNMQIAFGEIINNFKDELSARGFWVISDIEWSSCYVNVNGEFLQRIFDNVISNILKYADRSEKITISTVDTGESCGFSVMNTCSVSNNQSEGNGIGIESIRTMMQQMGGTCTAKHTESCFEITLLFPIQM